MKPCTPRSWSDRRLLIGLGWLAFAALGGGLLLGNVLAVLLLLGLLVCADLIWVELARRSPRPVGDLKLTVEPLGREGACLTDMTYRLGAEITPARDLHAALVMPLVPAGFEPREPAGARGRLRAGYIERLTFELRARRPGVAVFPGVSLRLPSPLRLFSRPLLLVDRRTLTVLPNYRSESHPLLARFMRPLREALVTRRRVVRGHGTDFHELREYRDTDPMSRVDWKATARRRELMVREFEEPREFSISLVLDASIDMTRGTSGEAGFANAAEFIARLGFVALTQGFGVRLATYDEHGTRQHRMGNGTTGFVRLLSELVQLPRTAALRAMDRGGRAHLEDLAAETWSWMRRQLGAAAVAETRQTFLGRYLGEGAVVEAPEAALVADWRPHIELRAPAPCRNCGSRTPPRGQDCPRCGASTARADPPDRAAMAVEALTRALAATRGREMLIFLSALRGGEVGAGVLPVLQRAARGHRSVHVVLPTHDELSNARPDRPGSLGHAPTKSDLMSDLERLRQAAEFEVFRSALLGCGAKVHPIDDRDGLDRTVAALLLAEVLAA